MIPLSQHLEDGPEPEHPPLLLLTVPQVAQALGLGVTKVYELMKYENLPYIPIGDLKRVSLRSLQEWIKQREHIGNRMAGEVDDRERRRIEASVRQAREPEFTPQQQTSQRTSHDRTRPTRRAKGV